MIRVRGLVRASSLLRQQLQSGIGPEDAPEFRQQVASVLRTVDAVCRQNGMTPDQLPLRSKRAYQYLQELDTEHLAFPTTRVPPQVPLPAAPSIAIKNVVRGGDYLANLLWQQSSTSPNSAMPVRSIKENLQRPVDAIERICAEQGATPAALATPSRRVYCWLKFLLSEDNLTRHLTALAQARTGLSRRQLHLDHPFHLYLVNQDSLWRKNSYKSKLLLKVNEGFLSAGQDTWDALIQTALRRRDPVSEQRVRGFGNSEEFSEVLFELETFAAPVLTAAQGQFHNLNESYERVNLGYFQGKMPRPNLVWSQIRTVQTFGHYQANRDTVMISLSLDHPTVPSSLVDYLMYHELLHKKHGATVVNGRYLVHTAAFGEDEREFSDYEVARRQLTDLALSLRGGAQQSSVIS
jgi:hypothetical protein